MASSDTPIMEANDDFEEEYEDEEFDEAQAQVEMLNDPGVEHLPRAGDIGGGWHGGGEDVFSQGSYGSSVGAPVSSPLFEHAAAFPQAKQLRIWEIVEGIPQGLGVMGILCTETEFISKFRGAMPGKFKMRPIDLNGRYVGQEFTTIISGNHAALHAPPQNGSAPANGGDGYMPLMNKMFGFQEDRFERMRMEMESERRSIANERSELAEERIALASNAASGVQAVAERMMTSDQARQDQITQTLTGIFQQQIQLMQMQAEGERQRHQQGLDRLHQEQTFTLEKERDRLAREREKERDWNAEREKDRDRRSAKETEDNRGRERLRKQEMELSLQREREHAERMMNLSKSEGGLAPVKKLLGEFGLKPMDVIEMMRGNNDGAEAGLGTTIVKGLTDVGRSFADAAKSNAEGQAKVAEAQAMAAQAQAELPYFDEEGYPEIESAAGAPVTPTVVPRPQDQYSTRNPAVLEAFAKPPQAEVPAPPTPSELMPLLSLRKARKAVRELVGRCMQTDESDWEGLITLGVSSEPAIIQYARVSSIRQILLECGADQGFAARMLAAIDRSGLVPSDIPRG